MIRYIDGVYAVTCDLCGYEEKWCCADALALDDLLNGAGWGKVVQGRLICRACGDDGKTVESPLDEGEAEMSTECHDCEGSTLVQCRAALEVERIRSATTIVTATADWQMAGDDLFQRLMTSATEYLIRHFDDDKETP